MSEEDIQMTAAGPAEAKAESSTTIAEETGSDDRELMTKAANQTEFYFADANLPYDKFMWTLYSKDPEHWVPVETVASFKRMREYTSRGLDWVVTALRTSDFLEVDEAGKMVRRRTEVQEPKGQFERSVYAKGFPDEDFTLQRRLEDFFNKYGKTNVVRMRRDGDKKFKNSVFAEFADFKDVDTFLKGDPKPTFDGKELLIMSKEAYCEMKIKEKGLTGKAANNRRQLMSKNGGFNAFKDTARAKTEDKPKQEVYLEFMGSKVLIQQNEDGVGCIKPDDIPFVKGATLRFDGCGGDVVWSEIKEPIREKFDGRPPFIKYSRGEDFGLVGFHKALSEEDIVFIKETIKTLNSHEVTWSVPEEEVEKEFQIERAQIGAKAAFISVTGGRDRGRGSWRGRGGGRDSGRGGKSGRGRRGVKGGRDRNNTTTSEVKEAAEETGDKRKRAVEPDGGPDVGVRGAAAPPVLQRSTSKKAKTDEDATTA